MNKLSTRLKIYRKQKNLTQIELAKKLGYSSRTIGRWESGYIKKTSLPIIESILNGEII